MNRADLVFAICHMIGIRSHEAEAEAAGSAAA
jgi:methylenetetrahydrofolate reductase (NADPH)